MDWLDALILGIVQGLAEYLPISSSGQLEICQHFLLDPEVIEGSKTLQFDLTLHVATVLSTIVVLWREFSKICTSVFTWRQDEDFRLFWKIILSCVPVGIVGVFFKKNIENLFGGRLDVVGICLLITAGLLIFAYFFRTRDLIKRQGEYASSKAGRPIGWIDAFVIGIAQAVAVLPGLSRSGSTIATGIILGNKRDAVAKFSFLMVIIPILGEGLLDVVKNLGQGEAAAGQTEIMPIIIGFISAFIIGCIACNWMINLVKRGKLVWFALFCGVEAILCLIFS